MAHIASCIQPGVNDHRPSFASYIVRPLSPLPAADYTEEQKPWVWRMMAQPETRKYQLFPREKQTTPSQSKGLDPEQAFALAMGQNGDKADKASVGTLRLRMKEHNLNLVRRRKVSVPELGPMTTVHESSMDSPTIPGRPAFHERSASAPGNNWKQHYPAYKNTTERSEWPHPPQSPKDLPPLVIPSYSQMSTVSPLKTQSSASRLRSGSAGSNDPSIPSSSVARPEASPKARTPFTPLSATQTVFTPLSSTTCYSALSVSTVPTPISATTESRFSPKLWKLDVTTETPREEPTEFSNNTSTPQSAVEPRPNANILAHRRNVSDSSSIAGSIMDRGRPRKKPDTVLKKSASVRNKSTERRAFEHLPKGWKPSDAVQMLDASETAALNKQAMQQAERFEILRKADVDSLSRELRNLDERCEYLRRTYHSLRAGRRNLHSRICQYLRSPRMVKFSQDSLLKQEEALAELDASIDDWVSKLEQAENRRTRVRQKLLEHVAAAVILPAAGSAGASGALQLALGISTPPPPSNISTPPRSPTRATTPTQSGSSSPPPLRVVAQVPSTILDQPIIEEDPVGLGIEQSKDQEAETKKSEEPLTAGMRRCDVESIRIYAGDEVAALLADVEQQITSMSKASEHNASIREKEANNLSDQERKEIHRAQSQEALQGGSNSSKTTPVSATRPPIAPTSRSATPVTSTPETKEDDCTFLLSSAVFNPHTAISQ